MLSCFGGFFKVETHMSDVVPLSRQGTRTWTSYLTERYKYSIYVGISHSYIVDNLMVKYTCKELHGEMYRCFSVLSLSLFVYGRFHKYMCIWIRTLTDAKICAVNQALRSTVVQAVKQTGKWIEAF